MNRIKKHLIVELLFLFLISLTPFFWLKQSQIILGHDSGFRVHMLEYFKQLFYSWNPTNGFGSDWSINKGFLITQIPEVFLTWITGSLQLGQQLSFVFWFFAIAVSYYLMITQFFPKKEQWSTRILSSVMYLYNFYLLQGWFITERAKFSLYVALPLLFLISYKALTKKWRKFRSACLFSLTIFIFNGGGIPPLFGAILLTQGVLFIYFTFLHKKNELVASILHSTQLAVLFITCTFFLNAFWIFPQIYLAKTQYAVTLHNIGGLSSILSWEKVISKHSSLLNLARMQGIPDWYDNQNHPYSSIFLTNAIFIFLSFLPITFVIVTFLQHPKLSKDSQKIYLFFVVLLCVGMFFTAGSHPPFGFIYELFLRFVPGFALFRSAYYKFAPATLFALVTLVGISFHYFISKRNQKVQTLTTVVCLALVFLYHFPFFTSNFFVFDPPFTTKVELPSYTTRTAQFVKENMSESRIILLPKLFPSFLVDSYSWGFFSFDLLPRLLFSSSIVANETNSPVLVRLLYEAIEKNNSVLTEALIKKLSIDHLLWRSDVLYQNKKRNTLPFQQLKNDVEQIPFLESEYIDQEWTLYRSKSQPNSEFTTVAGLHEIDTASAHHYEMLEQHPEVLEGFIYKGGVSEELQKELDPFIKTSYVSLFCITCQKIEVGHVHFELPYTRFKPSSPLYPFIIWRENWNINNQPSTAEKVDKYLFYASKRISEMKKLTPQEIEENTLIPSYLFLIEKAFENTQQLGFDERYKKLIMVRLWLEFHVRELKDYRPEVADKVEEQIKDIESNVLLFDKVVERIEKETKNIYHFEVTHPGLYRLSEDINPEEVNILNIDKDFQAETWLETGKYVIELPHQNDELFLIKISDTLGMNSFENLKFSFIDPTLATVQLPKREEAYILRLNQTYNPGWKIYSIANNEPIWSFLFKRSIAENTHFMIDGYANAWLLSKSEQTTVLLLYWPQFIFYIGLVVSSMSLLLIIFSLLYDFRRKL